MPGDFRDILSILISLAIDFPFSHIENVNGKNSALLESLRTIRSI